MQIPKQSEKHERELQEIVKEEKRPVALSSTIDEAHDLNGHTRMVSTSECWFEGLRLQLFWPRTG